MKKRTASLALVLVGTGAALAGCGNNDECDPKTDEGCTRRNGRAGYYGGAGFIRGGGIRPNVGGGVGNGGANGDAAGSTRGGFGSSGRGTTSAGG